MKKTYSAEPGIKKILAHYATASTAYQSVNPDMSHWTYAETFIGFKKALGWTIVAGEPVGPMAAQSEAMAAFEAAHPRVAYFAAEAAFYDRHRGTHPHAVYLGSQPVWTPEDWAKAMRHAPLRYQCHRTKNKGMRISEVSATAAGLKPDFDRLRKAWLGTRGLPPLHFGAVAKRKN